MKNRKSPILPQLVFLLIISAGTSTAYAQESPANHPHAFIDRFYTDEGQVIDRNRAVTSVPESALPYSDDAEVETKVERTMPATEPEHTSLQEAGASIALQQRVSIDESLVKPSPVRQLSCRPY